MLILAISTSSNTCSVSLLENEECIEELNIINQKTHSENLMPLIDKLFKKTNRLLEDVNLIACDNGPGSFTGIRIGVSTVKAIAEVMQIPVISVSSLEALSYNVNKENTNIVSLIDARNNQVYAGIFNYKHEIIEQYLADDIEKIKKILNNYKDFICVGDGFNTHKELFNQKEIYDDMIHSKNIGINAYHKYINGKLQTADEIKPMYLRRSQAERIKK